MGSNTEESKRKTNKYRGNTNRSVAREGRDQKGKSWEFRCGLKKKGYKLSVFILGPFTNSQTMMKAEKGVAEGGGI